MRRLKIRMIGLSYAEERMMTCQAVLIQYRSVTDGQRDGRTNCYSNIARQHCSADARLKLHHARARLAYEHVLSYGTRDVVQSVISLVDS